MHAETDSPPLQRGSSLSRLFRQAPTTPRAWMPPWHQRWPVAPVVSSLRALWRTTLLNAQLTGAEITRRPRNFLIGVATVLIVVFSTSAIINGVSKSGVVFLKLNEEQTGEIDVLMTAGQAGVSGELPFLDQAAMQRALANSSNIRGTTPRWIVTATARKKWPKPGEEDQTVATTLLIMDSAKERELPIGRGWPLRQLGEGECHVKDSILRQLGVRAELGEHILVKLDAIDFLKERGFTSDQQILTLFNESGIGSANTTDLLTVAQRAVGLNDEDRVEVNVTRLAEQIGSVFDVDAQRVNGTDEIQSSTVKELRDNFGETAFGGLSPNSTTEFNVSNFVLNQLGDLELDMDVVGQIGPPQGKYPAALGNVIIVDSTLLIRTMFEQLCYSNQRRVINSLFNAGLPTATEIIGDFDVHENAMLVYGLFTDRQDLYTLGKKNMDKEIVVRGDELMRGVDIRYNATVTYPLAVAMQASYYLGLFIGQILSCTTIIIGILGCILIYSLLLSNVEERTYEHGMIRALGLTKCALINLLTLQALTFAIPGVAVAIALAFVTNIIVEESLSEFSKFEPRYGSINTYSLVIPICIGVCVPLIANIIPIQRALGRSLRDALDIAHQSQTVTEVTAQRLEDMGLKLWQTLLAVFMVLAGLMVYYLMPYAFIFDDLPLFFWMLLVILLGMLLGLCMISSALQSPLERGILRLILHGKDRVLRVLIQKNLSMHRSRSSKTYMMFTISSGSVIFGGVVFTLMATAIKANIDAFVGADLQVWSQDFDTPLDRADLDEFLRTQRGGGGPVDDWAYVTFAHKQYDQFGTARASNLLFFPRSSQMLHGVDKNFLNVVYADYFMIEEQEEGVPYKDVRGSSKPDVVKSMYDVKASQDTFRPSIVYSSIPPRGAQRNSGNGNEWDFDPDAIDVNEKYAKAIDVIVSYGAKKHMSTTVKTTMKIELEFRREGEYFSEYANYLAKPRALISKLPGYPFVVSRYTFLLSVAPLLMTVDSFQMLLNENTFVKNSSGFPEGHHSETTSQGGVHVVIDPLTEDKRSPTEIRWEKLFVRLKPGTSTTAREDFINQLKSHLSRELQVVFDAAEWKETTVVAITMLMIFFYSVSLVSLCLNFFLLWVSFATNVKQNAWTFAVMRAIGFTTNQLIRVYIYEALATVLAAFLCGTVVGLLIAVTLTLQFNMFVEMPFHFDFPWAFFSVLLAEAVISAVFGSWVPARALRKREIAQLLKTT
eukprot:TRINITY_DN16223_c0_g2_i1.p1 TRINITY_DN16223_c0_g2~~TRINITY_DN16223_c0_g2_i1.p1  ORF type:complete len:1302 (+),score=431.16 TRINITY_DN16223_c0_g2_i1:222-3908(+)